MERKWRTLIIVCVGIFMLLLDITVVNVALPDIQRELHSSFTDLQWVVDAYALMLATVMLNAGSLGDWLGRKRVFLAGIAFFTAASAACGAAQSPLFLELARGAQGIGGAVMFAVSLAIVAQEFHGKERGTAFGIWGATVGAAVAIGPLVGGALTEWGGWRWIFFVNVPIGVLCIIFGARVLHESRDESHGGFDLGGFLTLTGLPNSEKSTLYSESLPSSTFGKRRASDRLDWGEGTGKLIRPGQDCSEAYGYAVTFNRVEVLSDTEYREVPIARIIPDWLPGNRGTHTFNQSDKFQVIDGRILIKRRNFHSIK